MKVNKITLKAVNETGMIEIVVCVDGVELGRVSKNELKANHEITLPLESEYSQGFHTVERYDNEDGTFSAIVEDFKVTAEDEIDALELEVMAIRKEIFAFETMSADDILAMADAGCELKRRIVKAVQSLRNEKFIKNIHSDYFAKSQF